MNSGNIPNTHFSSLENDFRAEVIAADLVESGADEERILILMLGALKRPFSRDVTSVTDELSEYNHEEYLLVKTPREGIYDMLPEGLFHNPPAHKATRTEKEIIQIMKSLKEEERNARKFFLPFESAINFLRIQMALYENRLDKRSHYNELVKIFSTQWEIFQYLDARQANIFLHLIPILHGVRDDLPSIEKIMAMMLQLPVKISLRNQLPLHPSQPIISKLGEAALGVDFTTGNAVYDDGVDEILVKIGPLKKFALNEFTSNGKKNKILQLLSDYLLPVHIDIITEFALDQNDRAIRLADVESDLNSVLGGDTYL